MIQKLEWDSEFFGLIVGELNLDSDKYRENYREFDLLYIISAQDFDLKLSDFSLTFSEEKVIYSKNLSAIESVSDSVFSFRETEFGIDDVYAIAIESGKNSRFLLDPNFNYGKFENLYKKWIDNSFYEGFADDVLLYKLDNELVGLLTYKTKDHEGFVGLLAVSLNHQGKGIGQKLLLHLETFLSSKGITTLNIPTQTRNLQACNFYKKAGYDISERTFIKHYWKNK